MSSPKSKQLRCMDLLKGIKAGTVNPATLLPDQRRPLVDDLKRRLLSRGRKIYIRSLHHSSRKISRIGSLEPHVSQGFLRFNRKHQELLRQLTQFPMAKNDDGPDALEMAVYTATQIKIVGALRPSNKYRF